MMYLNIYGRKSFFAKKKKHFFHWTSVKHLGHIVKAGNIHVDPDINQVIRTWLKLTTVKKLQQFLGLANCYA